MTRGLVMLSMLWSASSLAAGNVYAVLPTQGVGATTEASLSSQTMRLALQEQSLALVPQSQVDSAVVVHTVACSQSLVACGRLVGQSTSASHVLLSELWDQAGTLELKVALLDVRVEQAPVWTVMRTTQSAEIGPLSKKAALSLVSPQSLSGVLSVNGSAGVEIVVDGVTQATTPLLSPLRLGAGPHEVELRAGGHTAQTTVQVTSGSSTSLSVCATPSSVTTSPCPEPAPFPVLGAAGGVGLGLGVVGLGVAGATQGSALSSRDRFAGGGGTDAGLRDEALLLQRTALVVGAMGGALVVAGAAAVVVEAVVE